MSKDLKVALLLDFYGEMLTEKQRNVIELYYDEDLSLAEIAETELITRQGVRDSIKRGEQQLFELEEKLHLAEKFDTYKQIMDSINQYAEKIYSECSMYSCPRSISNGAKSIIECVKKSKDVI